jgi:amicyanin
MSQRKIKEAGANMSADTDIHLVIPGRTRKRANPESRGPGRLASFSGFRARVLRTRFGMTAIFAVAVFLAALAIAPARAADVTVKIANFTFSPQQLTVKTGTTVSWTNEDDIPHTVNASNKTFKSGALDTDQKFSFTFTTPGTYQYFCALHPHMTGTIVVEAATGSNAPR